MTITLYPVYTVIWAKLCVDSYLEEENALFYRVETDMKLHAFCQLCKMLNDPKEPVKVRDHLNAWWKIGGHCKRKGSYPWSNYRSGSYFPKLWISVTKPDYKATFCQSLFNSFIRNLTIFTIIYLMSIIYGIALSRYGNPNSLIIPFQAIISGGQLAGEIDTRWRQYLK